MFQPPPAIRLTNPSNNPTLWNYTHPGKCQRTLTEHNRSVNALTGYSNNSLVSGSEDKTIKLWNVGSGQCLKILTGHSGGICAVTICPNDQLASGGGFGDCQIKIWDMKTGQFVQSLIGHTRLVSALTMTSLGQLASASFDKTVRFWDLRSGSQYQRILEGHVDPVTALTTCSEKQLASASRGTIILWDMTIRQREQTLEDSGSSIMTLSMCPQNQLASGSMEEIKIWDLINRKVKKTLKSHTGIVNSLIVNPEEQLVSGSDDKTLKVWDLASGECLQTLAGHSGEVKTIAFCPQGQVASGSDDSTIKIWEFSSVEAIRRRQPSQPQTSVAKVAPPPSPAAAASSAAPTSAKTDIDELFNKAHELHKQGNFQEAMRWYSRAARLGNTTASQRLANFEKIVSDVKKEFLLPVEKAALEKQAEEADERENTQAAEYVKMGDKCFEEAQFKKAKLFYRKAAQAKHAEADAKLKQIDKVLKLLQLSDKGSITKSLAQLPTLKVNVEIPSSALTFQEKISEYGFATAYKGKWKNKTVTIKKLEIKTLSKDDLKAFIEESQILSQLQHPSIVCIYKICTEPQNYCIVMEYCEKGSLHQWLTTTAGESWPMRMQMGLDIARGIAYLNDNNIIHRNLNSFCILLNENFKAKIANFGFVNLKFESAKASNTPQGDEVTVRWRAPELLQREKPQNLDKVDVYSLGIILWELVTRQLPYYEQRNNTLARVLISHGTQLVLPKETSPSLATLIGKCWDKRSENRPTAKAVANELEEMKEALIQLRR